MRIVGGDGSGSTITCTARRITTFQDVAEELTISSFYFDGATGWLSGSEYVDMGRPLQPPRGKTDPFLVDFFKDQCADGGAYLKHSLDCGRCDYFLNQNGCPCRAPSSAITQDTDFNYNFCRGPCCRTRPPNQHRSNPRWNRTCCFLPDPRRLTNPLLPLHYRHHPKHTHTHTYTRATSATRASLAPPQSSLGRSSPSR